MKTESNTQPPFSSGNPPLPKRSLFSLFLDHYVRACNAADEVSIGFCDRWSLDYDPPTVMYTRVPPLTPNPHKQGTILVDGLTREDAARFWRHFLEQFDEWVGLPPEGSPIKLTNHFTDDVLFIVISCEMTQTVTEILPD